MYSNFLLIHNIIIKNYFGLANKNLNHCYFDWLPYLFILNFIHFKCLSHHFNQIYYFNIKDLFKILLHFIIIIAILYFLN